MEISIAAVGIFMFKLCGMFAVMGFSALFILWPINDQPTSKVQWIFWGIVQVITAILIFTNFITFKA